MQQTPGPGDDRIDSSTLPSGTEVQVNPGPGADEVIGGPAAENVYAGQATKDHVDRDVITLGAGRDHVSTGGFSANEDVIRLGRKQIR